MILYSPVCRHLTHSLEFRNFPEFPQWRHPDRLGRVWVIDEPFQTFLGENQRPKTPRGVKERAESGGEDLLPAGHMRTSGLVLGGEGSCWSSKLTRPPH